MQGCCPLVAPNLESSKSILPDELRKLLKEPGKVTLVDVRELDEWNEGHIEGAIHIPMHLLPIKAPELIPDKNTCIVLYCYSGGRSGMSIETMEKMGYKQAKSLKGGISVYEE